MFENFQLLAYGDTGWGDELVTGLGVTLLLAFVTVPFALAFSFLIAWAKESSLRPVRVFGNVYTTIFRSLPEILTLLIVYFQLQIIIDWITSFISPNLKLSISPFVAGVLTLTLVISALGSEVVRAAYNAVPKGQREAGDSIGLSKRKSFFLIILPQMWPHMLPAFGNLWLILLKDTSLVSIIALSELVNFTEKAIATTKQPFFFYIVLAGIFVTLAFLSSRGQMALEKHVNRNLIEER